MNQSYVQIMNKCYKIAYFQANIAIIDIYNIILGRFSMSEQELSSLSCMDETYCVVCYSKLDSTGVSCKSCIYSVCTRCYQEMLAGGDDKCPNCRAKLAPVIKEVINNPVDIVIKDKVFENPINYFERYKATSITFENCKFVGSCRGMFKYCDKLRSINFGEIDTSEVTDMSEMFFGCKRLKELDLLSFNTSNVTNMSDMFADCYDLISLDLDLFDTSKVTNMSYMFSDCKNLISLDVSNFDFSNVTYMDDMFSANTNMETLNIDSLHIDSVDDLEFVITCGCDHLTVVKVGGRYLTQDEIAKISEF